MKKLNQNQTKKKIKKEKNEFYVLKFYYCIEN